MSGRLPKLLADVESQALFDLDLTAGAGLYVFRVLPGPVFITESQVRVVSPYSVGLVLA